jgi:hypothetical protein
MEIKIKLHQLKKWYPYIDRAIIDMPDGKHFILDTSKYSSYPFSLGLGNDNSYGEYWWDTPLGYTLTIDGEADVEIHLHDYAYDLRILQSNVFAQMELLQGRVGLGKAGLASEADYRKAKGCFNELAKDESEVV